MTYEMSKFIEQLKSREYYYQDSISFIQERWVTCLERGEKVGESPGQFSGGYGSEDWLYDNKKYSFGFDGVVLDSMIVESLK